jgi:hypothetical protein
MAGSSIAEPALALVTKERVPESYITRIKRRPLRKMRPLRDSIGAATPRSERDFWPPTPTSITWSTWSRTA